MGRWAVSDGADELFIVESLPEGRLSLDIPSHRPIVVTRERAELVHMFLGAAIGSLAATVITVVWMRQGVSRVAHAFAVFDLSAGFERIEPVAPCGRFQVSDLQRDELADRCRACQRALRDMR